MFISQKMLEVIILNPPFLGRGCALGQADFFFLYSMVSLVGKEEENLWVWNSC